MFRVTNIRKLSRSEIRTHHTAATSPILQNGSCAQVSKNYSISDVTFNYLFFWILEKYRELQPACQTISKNSTSYDQRTAVLLVRQMHTVPTYDVTNADTPTERVAGGSSGGGKYK